MVWKTFVLTGRTECSCNNNQIESGLWLRNPSEGQHGLLLFGVEFLINQPGGQKNRAPTAKRRINQSTYYNLYILLAPYGADYGHIQARPQDRE